MADVMLYPINSSKRNLISLNGMWDFTFDLDNQGNNLDFRVGHFKGQSIPVPSSFQDFFTERKYKEYTGDVWYKKIFYLNKDYDNYDINIRFNGVAHTSIIYLNGIEIYKHNGGFLPFSIKINEYIKYEKENILVVKVNNELSHYTLPAGEVEILNDGRKISKPYFDFFNYSGIIRPVNIIITPKESILDITLNHILKENYTITEYSVDTVSSSDLIVEVYDENNDLITKSIGTKGQILITNTNLWSVNKPYLYKFIFKLYLNNELKDEYFMNVGIRTISINKNKIFLNNKPIYLKGFGRHEDFYLSGRAENLNVIKRDFELLKWINANSFRTSHYPYSEEEYILADKEGILIIDELPAVGFFPSLMNAVDAGGKKEIGSFFDEEEVHIKTLNNHLNQLKDLILRDKNYASVISFSLFNEPDTTSSDKVVNYFKKVFDTCYELDAQKRPRTFAMLMNSTPDNCKCYQFCDFIMLNRYYGWYINGGPELGEVIIELDKELEKWDKTNKPVVFSEYGCDTLNGLRTLPDVMWSENYQIRYFEKYHNIFKKHKCVCGEHVWNFADFQTSEGIIRVDGNKKGVFKRDRNPKSAAFYLKERWKNK